MSSIAWSATLPCRTEAERRALAEESRASVRTRLAQKQPVYSAFLKRATAGPCGPGCKFIAADHSPARQEKETRS
jgi:hypothetical protein